MLYIIKKMHETLTHIYLCSCNYLFVVVLNLMPLMSVSSSYIFLCFFPTITTADCDHRLTPAYAGHEPLVVSHATSIASTMLSGSGPPSAARRLSERCAMRLAPRMTPSLAPPSSIEWCANHLMEACTMLMPCSLHAARMESRASK